MQENKGYCVDCEQRGHPMNFEPAINSSPQWLKNTEVFRSFHELQGAAQRD